MSDWHPSYDVLLATVGCPVCGAAAGYDCAVPPGGELDGQRDIHIDRILLATGTEPAAPEGVAGP